MSSLAEESADTASLERILSSIDVSPQTFLQSSTSLQAASLVAAKRILDPIVSGYSVFREVSLKGLDVEQVWEQVRLVGDRVAALVEKQKDLPSSEKNNGLYHGDAVDSDEESTEEGDADASENMLTDESEDEIEEEFEDNSEISKEEEEDVDDGEEDEDTSLDIDDEFPENLAADAESDEDLDMPANTSKPFKKDVHGLNDKFFSIDDFNRMTEQQDAAGSDIGDDEIDYLAGTHLPIDNTNSRPRRTSLGFG